jgi:soluble lytic murein transglycosylase-like protein
VRSRLPRLQVILLVVLGVWSIDSGMQGGAGHLGEAAAGLLPSVSASPAVESARPSFDAQALADLLGAVNPNLDRTELSRIAAAVIRYSEKYDLDPELVTAVLLVESTARPWVRSPKGAVGLMQVMPHMMEPLRLSGNAATIESNIEAGCFILSSNIRRLGEEEGISSYFWGRDIRGVAYLNKVQAAREEVRRHRTS